MQDIERTEGTEKTAVESSPSGNPEEVMQAGAEKEKAMPSADDGRQSDRINAGFAAMRRRYEKEIADLKAKAEGSERKSDIASGESENSVLQEGTEADFDSVDTAESERDGEETIREAAGTESGENDEGDAEAEQIQLRLDYLRELAEISRYDPSIRTPEDLERDPEIEKIRELISRGNTLADAWFLAHRTQLLDRMRAAGRKDVFREERSAAYPPVGSIPDVYVTPEECALFRAVMPGITDAEIRAAARKYRS